MLPRIVAVGTAVPQWCYSQQQLLEMAGRDRARETFSLHSDIDYRHLYFEPGFTCQETMDEMLGRALYRDGTAEAALGEAIFADGSGAMCLSREGAGFEVLGHKTLIRTEHIGLTGFGFPGGARRLVLSKDLPAVGAEVLADLAGALLLEPPRGRCSAGRHD